jgi:hypothetical protein
MLLRSLKPIEIAEGALLADIAVVYQLLVSYIPVVGDFFRFPIFIVFAVLVLRRDLYVGIMGGCVALFITAILMGPSRAPMLGIEVLGGLYLGVVMRLRLRSTVVVLLGATCGALTLYLMLGTTAILTGVPASVYVQSLHKLFTLAVHILDLITLRLTSFLHLAIIKNFWQHQLLPLVNFIANLAFTYWWLAIYVLLWGFSLVATFLVYMASNLCVRMLGYEVRPFPSERTMRMIQRRRRRMVRLVRNYIIRPIIKPIVGRFYAKV